jgi:flavin reductase (DIM6/NTAB) family NADH-FMN oxidoreductase RutF
MVPITDHSPGAGLADPSKGGVDRPQFAAVMSALASGVAIVTVRDGGGLPLGLTTTAVCSVSAEPPLLLVCVDRSSRTLPALLERSHFGVNFVGTPHGELCTLFASKAEDKFAGIAWRAGPHDVPVLEEHAIAWAVCQTQQVQDAGDHVIVVARIDAAKPPGDDADPLLFYRRSYGRLKPLDPA